MMVKVLEERVKERVCRLQREKERRQTYMTEERRRGGAYDNKCKNESKRKNLYMQQVSIGSEV